MNDLFRLASSSGENGGSVQLGNHIGQPVPHHLRGDGRGRDGDDSNSVRSEIIRGTGGDPQYSGYDRDGTCDGSQVSASVLRCWQWSIGLTLGRTISQTSSRDGIGYGRSKVDDHATLFRDPGRKSVVVV
jgi:hypothetical protein